MNMETQELKLAEQFTFDNFEFTQLKRAGDVALFKKKKPEHARESYELVIVQHYPAAIIHGRQYPNRETMTGNEQWGESAWSFSDLEHAETAFTLLCESKPQGRLEQERTSGPRFGQLVRETVKAAKKPQINAAL